MWPYPKLLYLKLPECLDLADVLVFIYRRLDGSSNKNLIKHMDGCLGNKINAKDMVF